MVAENRSDAPVCASHMLEESDWTSLIWPVTKARAEMSSCESVLVVKIINRIGSRDKLAVRPGVLPAPAMSNPCLVRAGDSVESRCGAVV